MKKLLFALGLLFSTAACSNVIHDNQTKPSLTDTVLPGSDRPSLQVVDTLDDSMDRGQHDLSRNVIVDTTFYQSHPLARGDIVYFNNSTLSRIVALPNERMNISKGQIYINDKKLDTFYGSAHIRGYNYSDFQKSDLDPSAKQALTTEIFRKNLAETTLLSDEIYVIGDDWSRSGSKTTFRIININEVQGKAVGVCTTCKGNGGDGK